MLRYGIPGPVVYRTIVIWAHANIHVIVANAITSAYTQDRSAIQGDVAAQLLYVVYTYPAYERMRDLHVGYNVSLTGYRLCVPDVEFSDDTTPVAEILGNLKRLSQVGADALLPRLLVSDPSKGNILAVGWRKCADVWQPRSMRVEVVEQGIRIPVLTLRNHARNLGLELYVFVGSAFAVRRLRKAVKMVWAGAIRGHMLMSTASTVHSQVCIGIAHHFAMCSPPPAQQLRAIDASVSYHLKRKCSWAAGANSRAAFAPNGGNIASVERYTIARFIAALISDLNCPLQPARLVIRQQYLEGLRNPTEKTEYVMARRLLAPLRLTIAAASPPQGVADCPQLACMEQHGMRRIPAWEPPTAQSVTNPVFIDESVGPGTATTALIYPAQRGRIGMYKCGIPAHLADTRPATLIGIYIASRAIDRPPPPLSQPDGATVGSRVPCRGLKHST